MTRRPDPRQFDLLALLAPIAPLPPAAPDTAEALDDWRDRMAQLADEEAIAEREAAADDPEFDAPEAPPGEAPDDVPPVIQPARDCMPVDALGDRLIALGLATNAYLLDINGSLAVPHDFALPAPWNLPSRLFRFPIETRRAAIDRNGAHCPRRIGLMHPLLGDHPYVQHVADALGTPIDPHGAPNPYGYTKTEIGPWWHAVDLMTSGHWRELLETSEFTTPKDILRAVAHTLDYQSRATLTLSDARAILAELGADDPGFSLQLIRDAFSPPTQLAQEGRKAPSWPINRAMPQGGVRKLCAGDEVWAWVHALDRGWFVYGRDGFAQWSDTGRKGAAGEATQLL